MTSSVIMCSKTTKCKRFRRKLIKKGHTFILSMLHHTRGLRIYLKLTCMTKEFSLTSQLGLKDKESKIYNIRYFRKRREIKRTMPRSMVRWSDLW